MIYFLLEPDYGEETEDIRKIQTEDNDDNIEEHEDAYLMRFHLEMRKLYFVSYISKFGADLEDYIEFDIHSVDA